MGKIPPPPGPPPPPDAPPPPVFSPAPLSDTKNRSALLHSIRAGTSLKKTFTNDRSAPAVASKVNGVEDGSKLRRPGGGGFNGSATIARSNGLAGLFADGMPKLKPVGHKNFGQSQSSSLTSLNDTSPKNAASPINSSIHSLNERVNGIGGGHNKMEIGRRTVDPKNRGPPPQPPPQSQKPVLPTSVSDNRLSVGSHSRSDSTVSLPNGSSVRPKVKPQLAPKPPAPAPPGPGAMRHRPARAHSMRAPASPPVIASANGAWFSSSGELSTARSSFLHQSAENLRTRRPTERPPPPPRPTVAAPPPPITAPQPPGLSPGRVQPPVTASPGRIPTPASLPVSPSVPPPPTSVPPPPPVRTTSAQRSDIVNLQPSPTSGRTGLPPLPSSQPPPLPSSQPPPLPPSRHAASIRHSQLSVDFDARFIFRPSKDFPPPPSFRGVAKVYNSKTAKQPAPAPPTHIQLANKMWANDSSTC